MRGATFFKQGLVTRTLYEGEVPHLWHVLKFLSVINKTFAKTNILQTFLFNSSPEPHNDADVSVYFFQFLDVYGL